MWETMVRAPATLFWELETAVWVSVISRRVAGAVTIAGSFLERKVSTSFHSSDRTHAEDLKNPVEVRFPGADLLFILPRVKVARDCAPLTPLVQLPLNLCYGPAIDGVSTDGSVCAEPVRLTMSFASSHHTQTD